MENKTRGTRLLFITHSLSYITLCGTLGLQRFNRVPVESDPLKVVLSSAGLGCSFRQAISHSSRPHFQPRLNIKLFALWPLWLVVFHLILHTIYLFLFPGHF